MANQIGVKPELLNRHSSAGYIGTTKNIKKTYEERKEERIQDWERRFEKTKETLEVLREQKKKRKELIKSRNQKLTAKEKAERDKFELMEMEREEQLK